MSLILVALILGGLITEFILYPKIAYLVRDTVSWVFRSVGFYIINVNSSKGIGLSFNDYVIITSPTEVDVLHGVLTAGCITFSPFLALATDYSIYHITKLINEEEIKFRTISSIIIKTCLLVFFFLPFTFFRFVLILMVFLLLWNTPLWAMHYSIGHDLIGNVILFTILISMYCFLVHSEYWKHQFLTLKQRFLDLRIRIVKSIQKYKNR